jgi:prepilin-type N-terminal cleavage/methylation domain-containing protein
MKQRGFTLIEVLIALLILTGAIIVLSTSWSGNFLRMRKANMYNDAATLLEQKIQEIEAKYKDKPIGEVPEKDDGEFEGGYKKYRWAMKSKDLKFPDISPLLTSQQEGGVDETLLSMVKQVTEYLSTAVKELKVSVFVKGANGKEVEFSATEYLVDYTKEFQGLPGGAAGGPAAGPAGTGGAGNGGNP